MSPVIWTSINQGRLGTLAVALIAPSFLSILPKSTNFEIFSWRRTYALILLAAILSAFSAFFLIIWTGLFAVLLGIELYSRRLEIKVQKPINYLMTAELARIKRLTALLIIPGLLVAPWSASVILHPTQILQDPGLPLSGGSLINILTFNPGGLSGVPGWILTPFVIFLIAMALTRKYPLESAIAISLFSVAVLLSQITVVGHGSSARVWTGTLFVFIELIILIPILQIASELVLNLRNSRVGIGHLLSVATVAIAIFSLATTSAWAISVGAKSLVASGKSEVVPPFIASLSDTPNRPKTLVIGRTGEELNYFISRGSDLEIGDADVAVATPMPVRSAIIDLISGSGLTSSKVLGDYGIQYLFLKNPVDQSVVRTVDGIGGFTRSSVTSSGIIWQVVGSKPRVSILDGSGTVSPINSTKVGAAAELKITGIITLAEKFDTRWHILVNGKQVKLSQSPEGLPTFEVREIGPMTLLHDGTRHRALISLELIALLVVVVLTLPAGRRRREVPVEELA
jgi:hypothetical protein